MKITKTKFASWLKKIIVWAMIGGVIILFLLNFCMIFFVPIENTRGTFGDQFGAVNAMILGLAFTGLIYTIILQRSDLEIQRFERYAMLKNLREDLLVEGIDVGTYEDLAYVKTRPEQ